MELEVVWNGSHESRDADLLCCPAIPEKRYDVPVNTEPIEVSRIAPTSTLGPVHQAVWTCLAHGAWTSKEIQRATGFPMPDVQLALTRLRKQFAVRIEEIPLEQRTGRLSVTYSRWDEG